MHPSPARRWYPGALPGRGLAAFLALLAFAGAAFAAAPAAGDEPIAVPPLTAHVVDQTGTLDASQRAALEAKLAEFERARGSQVAVLLVPSTGTEPIEDFATRVTDQWQLGRKGVDDGVLLVVAKQQRKLRIQTGRGVQGTLTDLLSKRIVSDIIAPHFRSGDFPGGIDAGVDAIMKAIEGEALPLPQHNAAARPHGGGSFSNFLILGFLLVPVVGFALRSLVGRFVGASATGGLTGTAAWFVFGSLGFGVIAALAAFAFTLLGGTGVGRGPGSGWRGGGGFGGWGGGFGGGGFGGSGGGGGFSGGGGSFDGGGSSGSW